MIKLLITKDVTTIVDGHEITVYREGSNVYGFSNITGEGFTSYMGSSEIHIPQDSAEVTETMYYIERHGEDFALCSLSERSRVLHGKKLCSLSDFDHNGAETRKLIEDTLNKRTTDKHGDPGLKLLGGRTPSSGLEIELCEKITEMHLYLKSVLVYEDTLPDMADEEYNVWFNKSVLIDGVRMGPKV